MAVVVPEVSKVVIIMFTSINSGFVPLLWSAAYETHQYITALW